MRALNAPQSTGHAPVAMLAGLLRVDSCGAAALEPLPRMSANVSVPDARADLLDRARAGDASAFRELYALHHRQIASQLAFLVPRSDLEDVLQDVFIEV